jgi:hypothetical protein
MTNPHDTQPNLRPVRLKSEEGVAAPPKILLYGVIGFTLVVILGLVASYMVFNNVLSSGQQQRVIDALPFMGTFLYREPTPIGGALPTVTPGGVSEQDAMSLLNMPLFTDEPTAPTIAPTATPAKALATAIPATATPAPTLTATPTPTATMDTSSSNSSAATPVSFAANQSASAAISIPVTERIFGLVHQQQTWNNCGPATITMALSYYGWQEDQKYAAQYLKPNREDKNVSPAELVNFVNTQTGVRALYRVGGDLTLLKTLISRKFPVVVETSAMFEAYDWLGHYRALIAYDDLTASLYFFDSFQGVGTAGEGVVIAYNAFDTDWQHFNRTFIVLYPQDREAELKTLLGNRAEEKSAAEHAFSIAQEEARKNPQDGHAWFNMGTALVKLERYQEAANAFDQARRRTLPWRMYWYQFGPFEAYYQVGRYEDVLSLAQSTLINAPELEEAYYWRGRVYMAQGRRQDAINELQQALSYNPDYVAAQTALNTLQQGA